MNCPRTLKVERSEGVRKVSCDLFRLAPLEFNYFKETPKQYDATYKEAEEYIKRRCTRCKRFIRKALNNETARHITH